MFALCLYLTLINAVAFLLMLIDKRKAQKKRWRIRESTLFIVAAMGGSIGTLLGMHIFRHKTKHITFTAGIPAILAGQVLLGILLYSIIK